MTYPQHPPVIYLQRAPGNGMAVTSLVLGIVAVLIAPWALIPLLGLFAVALAFVPIVLALVFGHGGLRASRRISGTGRGAAIAGLVMGYLSTATCLLSVLFLVAALAIGSNTP